MDIYYKIIGKGYPIVMLHGNGEDHHIFDQLTDQLKKQYQCILIDSRYHGKSIHQGQLTYPQLCQDIQDVISQLHIEQYDLIGFSDGAIIGLMLGMCDIRLKHLISIGANTQPRMIKFFYRLGMYVQKICLLPFCIYHPKARLTLKLTQLMLDEPYIEYTDLQKIHIPVLVMAGEYDMIKEIDTKTIAEYLPYSALKIIQQGNHFLLRDHFQQTYQEISLFLRACHQED